MNGKRWPSCSPTARSGLPASFRYVSCDVPAGMTLADYRRRRRRRRRRRGGAGYGGRDDEHHRSATSPCWPATAAVRATSNCAGARHAACAREHFAISELDAAAAARPGALAAEHDVYVGAARARSPDAPAPTT